MLSNYFRWFRFKTLAAKEVIQLLRDRMTFVYIIILSLSEVALFSIVFNSNPRYLPTAILDSDPSPFTRAIIRGLENTRYFKITRILKNEQEGEYLLASNQVQFVITFSPDFTRDLVRGRRPQVAVVADTLNPMTTSNALAAIKQLENQVLEHELRGTLSNLKTEQKKNPFEFVILEKYNPENDPHIFSVPGLIGTLMAGVLFMMTAISITREKDQGTMESLLTTPAHPIEITLSKIFPYVIIAFIQLTLMLLLAVFGFDIPFKGSIGLLYLGAFPFIVASLLWGLLVSALSKNQFQAMQLGGFFLLPNILFSGFVFPFRGMPEWAQWAGNILPLTHFIRILTGVMIKGSDYRIIIQDIWPMVLFIVLIIPLIILLFKQTLD